MVEHVIFPNLQLELLFSDDLERNTSLEMIASINSEFVAYFVIFQNLITRVHMNLNEIVLSKTI